MEEKTARKRGLIKDLIFDLQMNMVSQVRHVGNNSQRTEQSQAELSSNKKLKGKVVCLLVPEGVENDHPNSRQGSQQTFPGESQTVNLLAFEGCMVCVATTQLFVSWK